MVVVQIFDLQLTHHATVTWAMCALCFRSFRVVSYNQQCLLGYKRQLAAHQATDGVHTAQIAGNTPGYEPPCCILLLMMEVHLYKLHCPILLR